MNQLSGVPPYNFRNWKTEQSKDLLTMWLAIFNAMDVPHGTAVFTSAGTVDVVFLTPQGVDYIIKISGNANENFWWSAKSSTGFTIHSSNASSVASVDWEIN